MLVGSMVAGAAMVRRMIHSSNVMKEALFRRIVQRPQCHVRPILIVREQRPA
jgi:hypothetical protein